MNDIVTKTLSPTATVRADLEKMKSQFASALPKHITVDRMLRVAMTAVQNTPKLLDCDRTSLYSALMRSAQLGLEPDGLLGQAYLIPFDKNFKNPRTGEWEKKKEVQFIIGYKGWLDLARRSGDVISIFAKEVRENDHFVYQFGLNDVLDHIPSNGERGKITHFYAVAKFKSGGHHYDVMSVEEINAIRDAAQGYVSAKKTGKTVDSPWEKHYEEMGKKTAIRRIVKYLPLSVQKLALAEELTEQGKNVNMIDGDLVIEYEETQLTQPANAIDILNNAIPSHDADGVIIEQSDDKDTETVDMFEAEIVPSFDLAQLQTLPYSNQSEMLKLLKEAVISITAGKITKLDFMQAFPDLAIIAGHVGGGAMSQLEKINKM